LAQDPEFLKVVQASMMKVMEKAKNAEIPINEKGRRNQEETTYVEEI